MPKGKRKNQAEAFKPLITINRIIQERESFRLSRTVLTGIREYAVYIGQCTGEEPTRDEIVDRGMQRLLDSDRGFQQWLKKRNPAAGSSANGRTESPRTLTGENSVSGTEVSES